MICGAAHNRRRREKRKEKGIWETLMLFRVGLIVWFPARTLAACWLRVLAWAGIQYKGKNTHAAFFGSSLSGNLFGSPWLSILYPLIITKLLRIHKRYGNKFSFVFSSFAPSSPRIICFSQLLNCRSVMPMSFIMSFPPYSSMLASLDYIYIITYKL